MSVDGRKWRTGRSRFALFLLLVGVLQPTGGCGTAAGPEGDGPGRRPQELALSPDEELAIGREAYRRFSRSRTFSHQATRSCAACGRWDSGSSRRPGSGP